MGFLDDYEPVEHRIRAFWTDHPEGAIHTSLVAHEGGDYIVKAAVWRESSGKAPHATGYAHDSYDQLPPQMKASALEVCETSAIGRALANLGYAPKGKRPSREEMTKSSGPGSIPVPEETQSPGPDATPSPGLEGFEGGSEATGGNRREGKTVEPPVAYDLKVAWQELYDLVAGDKAAARRAVTKANRRTRAVTAQNESEVTEAEIQAAVAMVQGG